MGVATIERITSITQKDPASTNELMAWAANARPGDRVSYYIGNLGIDRERAFRLNIADGLADNISPLAALAFRLAKSGDVHLVQRRVGRADDNVFRYIAIRRAPRSP